MPTVSELNVVIGVDTRQLDSGLQKAGKDVDGFGASLKSGLGAGVAFGAVGAAIGLVGSAFSAAKGSIIDLNGSLEQSKIAFSTMLGSAEKADVFLKDLQTFAANTPFEFPDLVSASKKMLAFGFESKQVVPLLTAVGDAVAAVGGGAEVIDGVTTAIGQMTAKGKVSAEEMGQLAERGIPAWDMLAKKLGVSTAEAMDMVSKGQVKAATFVEAFQEGSAQRFGGMMEKQSATWSGALSTIKDSLSMATATAFRPFFELISAGAIQLSKFVQGETFTAWAASASGAITSVVDAIRGLINIFMGGGEFGQAAQALVRFFPAEVAIGILGLVNNLGDTFRAVFAGDLPRVIEGAQDVLRSFGGIIVGFVEDWASSFVAWVDGADSGMMDGLGDMLLGLGDWLQDAGITIASKLAVWAAAFVDWVGPKIPPLLAELGKLLVKVGVWFVTDAIPTTLTNLATWGLAFVEWVAPRIPLLLLEMAKLLSNLAIWIADTALPAIVLKLLEWGDAFTAWVLPMIPTLLLELGKLYIRLNLWIADQIIGIGSALLGWAAAFVDWVAKDVLPKLPGSLNQIVVAIGTWVGQQVAGIALEAGKVGAGIVKGIQDGVSGALGGFWSWLQANFVDKIPAFVRDLLNIRSPSGVFMGIGRQIVDGLRVGMEQRLPSIDDVVSRLVGRIATAGEVTDWLKAAMSVAGVGGDWLGGLQRLVQLESTGNPRAVNPQKVGNENASGLLQTLPSTYRAFRVKSLPDDIFNPISNAAAAIRYISDTYGHVNRIPGLLDGKFRGYGEGGWAGLHGPELAWLGERGPEYVVPNAHLRGGGIGRTDELVIDLRVDGRTAERIYVSGRDQAVRRGRVPASAG